MNVRALFEGELRKRHVPFSIDPESGRHAIEANGGRLLVSLDNLHREVARDGDTGRVVRFVDIVLASSGVADDSLSADRLYWCLEPCDHVDKADFRVALSDRVDRVLTHLSAEGRMIAWIAPTMLATLGLSEAEGGAKASGNLARALDEAKLEIEDIDGVQLGYLSTPLPFKSSLILAPNLREVIGATLGWPLLAVAPDRDFLYLWAARHSEFVGRVGGVVVEEYSKAAYPISTEVYEVSDEGVRAIGEFPRGRKHA